MLLFLVTVRLSVLTGVGIRGSLKTRILGKIACITRGENLAAQQDDPGHYSAITAAE